MWKLMNTLLTCSGLAMVGHAQTVAIFTVSQPPQFLVDAGEDLIYSGEPLILGGLPTATGGGGMYTYVWQPAAFLDDPTAPNPVLSGLAATTVFTVTVTDVVSGCMKSGEVEVVPFGFIGVNEIDAKWCLIHPNPATTEAWVEAKELMASITMRSLTGQEVLPTSYPASTYAHLDLSTVPDGMFVLTVSLVSGQNINYKLCKASSVR
jgi:hypothetical protein